MAHVSGVVDAETDGEHDVDAGDGIDGQAPEVHQPANVHLSNSRGRMSVLPIFIYLFRHTTTSTRQSVAILVEVKMGMS